MNISNRVALVTGGARIGATVAEALARRGCHVALSYRASKVSAIKSVQTLQKIGVGSAAFRGDMTREHDVRNVIRGVKKVFGGLDIVVNLVSVYEKTAWPKMRTSTWNRDVAGNLGAAQLIAAHAAPLMKKEGRIIHFSDWVAASGRPRYKEYAAYYTAKMGVIGLTQAQALELAPRVLVNCIAPGPILPPANSDRRLIDDVKRATPLARWGGAAEIAKAVIFLIESDFVTGETIRVDGGRHLL